MAHRKPGKILSVDEIQRYLGRRRNGGRKYDEFVRQTVMYSRNMTDAGAS